MKPQPKLRCGHGLLSELNGHQSSRLGFSKELVEVGLSQPFHYLDDSGELFTSHSLGMAMTELNGKS